MNKTYIPALIVVIALAVIHKIASANYWYVRFPGFDIFMHILGGAGIALSIYWILRTFFPKHKVSFWSIVVWTVLGGVLWEGFEMMNDIAGAPVGTSLYYLDTAKDLVDDTLGAVIAAFFIGKK
jgi:hypothetical protein